MTKIVLDYDDTTGAVTDKNVLIIGTWMGLVPFQEKKENKDTLALALKYAGASNDTILKLIE